MDTNRLIGMRVMNTVNHAIGTIEYTRDGIVAVSYHGTVAKHSYPSAFSSILELEDEELQESSPNLVRVSKLRNCATPR